MMYPTVLGAIANAKVSLARLTDYMNLPECTAREGSAAAAAAAAAFNEKHCNAAATAATNGAAKATSIDDVAVAVIDDATAATELTALVATATTNTIAAAVTTVAVVATNEKKKKLIGARVKDASFSWDASGKPAMRNVSFEVKPGTLVGAVGSVGSGKSTLTLALFGELPRLSGSIEMDESVAYVSQHPWIENITVRENIGRFGSIMHADYVKSVLALPCPFHLYYQTLTLDSSLSFLQT
jgi:ABC-type multidrug transport system fused ATPase/permease subunit